MGEGEGAKEASARFKTGQAMSKGGRPVRILVRNSRTSLHNANIGGPARFMSDGWREEQGRPFRGGGQEEGGTTPWTGRKRDRTFAWLRNKKRKDHSERAKDLALRAQK